MKHIYRLTQRVTKPGSVVRSYHCRLTDESGTALFDGDTRNGIPSKPWNFSDTKGASAMSFGPNRRMLANRYIVCDQHAARLATIRLPVVNTSFGGHCFEIDDQSGAHFMTLKSAETFEQGVLDKVGALCGDDLVLVKDGEILGYTGAESQPTGSRKPVSVAGVAKGVFERASELPGLVVESIKDEFGGANRIREERVAARLTLVGAGTDLDPRFVMGVLLFKTHVFSAIRDVS